MDERSDKSTRSASPHSLVIQFKNQNTRDPISYQKNEALNGSIMLGTTEEFHNSWLESRRQALEDIEEGSTDDVFQIGVVRDISLQENRAMSNIRSPSVSEWMKSVRVVNSASDIQSLAEQSHSKENNSMDLSLEGSLAASLVEI